MRGIAIVSRPSVCPSVRSSMTLRYGGRIGWITSKGITPMISLGLRCSEPQRRQSSPIVCVCDILLLKWVYNIRRWAFQQWLARRQLWYIPMTLNKMMNCRSLSTMSFTSLIRSRYLLTCMSTELCHYSLTSHTVVRMSSAGLLISKYRVLSILYRRYFLNIDGVIANTCEKSYR